MAGSEADTFLKSNKIAIKNFFFCLIITMGSIVRVIASDKTKYLRITSLQGQSIDSVMRKN